MQLLGSLFTPSLANRFLTAFTCVAALAVVLRYCFLDTRDISKCGALMNDGEWLDRPPEGSSAVPTEWQPPGCMIHKYTPVEASSCLMGRRVVFAGDSMLRQVFWGIAQKLDKTADPASAPRQSDIMVERLGVKLEFIWDPYLNSSRVKQELNRFKGDSYSGQKFERPSIMLMGAGLWYARYDEVDGLKNWKDSIDEVVTFMRSGRETTDVTKQDLVLLTPVTVPAWSKLSKERARTMTPKKVGEMNQYLQQISDIHGIDVMWSFNRMIKGLPQTMDDSGTHRVNQVLSVEADALLNMRCNANFSPNYPYDKTCCSKYEAPNYQQWFILAFSLGVAPLILILRCKADSSGIKTPWLPSKTHASALLVFCLALAYCFYADRTQVFSKLHKHYTILSFSVMTLLWLILGLSTITVNTGSDQPFMSRDQTNEWKGWLQCAILVYHYTGASKVAWIYGLIRITVASYLFMTGYGHTVYFYKKDDFSFKRVAGVLVRLNLLSCALPYIMKTEYIFYYFAPLVSFWFLIVYATMGIGSGGNKNIMFLLSKIAVSAILVTVIVKIPGVLEFLFKIPHYLARTEWNAAEFRFRVFLDMWIVYVGMGAAIAVIKLNDTNYAASIHKMWKPTLIASAVALPLFFLFQITRETKFAYNAYHPYISWIPILAFIALRNASPSLRNRHSEVFGWIGTCSLETFTLQYHIWMAADTHGLLDLSLFGGIWLVNFVISTVVFLFTSHCVARATGDLTGWILGAAPAKKAVVKKAVLPIFQRMEEVRLKELREASGVLEPAFETVKPVEAVAGTDSVVGLKARCGIIMAVMWVLNLTYKG